MQNDLISAYLDAEYRVAGFSRPIYIGEHSADADHLLSQNNLSEWAYITAYNPMSEPLSAAENAHRNIQLRALLNDFLVLAGEGQDKNKAWEAEQSFFVAGISLAAAKTLAIRFGQRAIVYGKIYQAAQLIETLDFAGRPVDVSPPVVP